MAARGDDFALLDRDLVDLGGDRRGYRQLIDQRFDHIDLCRGFVDIGLGDVDTGAFGFALDQQRLEAHQIPDR